MEQFNKKIEPRLTLNKVIFLEGGERPQLKNKEPEKGYIQQENPILSPEKHKKESLISEIFPSFEQLVTKQLEDSEIQHKQSTMLTDVVGQGVDTTITDYSVAYKRLNQESNAGWKLNPSDIANFYLLTEFVQNQPASSAEQGDSSYFAVAKAKTEVTDIGKRLLVALAHEQLEEYDCYAKLDTDRLPDDVKTKIQLHVGQGDISGGGTTLQDAMNAYLSDFKTKLDEHSSRGDVLKVFEERDMFDTALQILESQQSGRWKVMAIAMQGLLDKTYPIRSVVQSMFADEMDDQSFEQVEQTLEGNRETFLIDRLFNYIHNGGSIATRITNDIPRSLSLLVAHGLPRHSDYLLSHSSFINGSDTLSSLVRKGISGNLPENGEKALMDDLDGINLPREYELAMLLAFNNLRSGQHSAHFSPSVAYHFLRRASEHDGNSRGWIKRALRE